MKSQTSGYRLKRRSAGRLAGALGLLLALCLVVVGALPVYAAPPQIPHAFYGTVTVGDPPVPVAEGTAVEAYVGGVKKTETTVDHGEYSLLVSGTAGATVTFRVGSILANETAIWQSGAVTNLDLTVTVTGYDLTVDSTAGGSVTDPGEGVFTYVDGTVVDLLAVPDAGYQFVNWTGDTGAIDDVDAADTFITVNGTYAITANFELIPPPPAAQKLIGADDATPQGYGGALYQSICRFQAVATGTMTEFKVKFYANGTVAYAVYVDSSGSPGARLAQQATPQNVVEGWNTLAIDNVSITNGDYYWLAVYVATGAIGYNTSGGTRKYKAYASTFPDPFDNTGFTNDSIPVFEAGWGSTIAPEKPANPTLDFTALIFRWNASAGATNYHLQVNTKADFTGTDMFNGEVGNVTSREVTGLTGGNTYYYHVKAGNAAGWSGWCTCGSMRCE